MNNPAVPRLRARMILLVIALLVSGAGRLVAENWTRAEWRGEKAWISVSSCGWTAVVSEERARLIALNPPGSDINLLFADQKDEFSWCGHRFWLGPQSAWGKPWPPPSDWETSAADHVEADGERLRVTHKRTNADYPRISRTYAWRKSILHCTAAWNDARFHGIHILQVPPETVIRVNRTVSVKFPLGYILLPIYKRSGVWTDREVSPAVAGVRGDVITLRNAKISEKIGVPPQPIVAELAGYRLVLRRGIQTGLSDVSPDMGMLTQVFLGSDRSVFTEIEQLTAFGGSGEGVSEILIDVGMCRAPSGFAPRNPVRRR